MTAPTVRGTPVTANTDAGRGQSITLPFSGAQADDVRLVVAAVDGDATGHAITGFTHLTGSPRTTEADDTAAAFSKVSGASEAAATMTWSSSTDEQCAIAETVVQDTGGINGQSTAFGTTGSLDIPSITTTENDCLLVVGVATERGTATTINTPVGWTQVAIEQTNAPGTGGAGCAMFTKTQATAGSTGVMTFTTSSSADAFYGWAVALEPTAGGSSFQAAWAAHSNGVIS